MAKEKTALRARQSQKSSINYPYINTISADRPRLIRVRRANPCAVCEHTDWCSVSEDGAIAVCMRVAEGAAKDARNGGYIHVLRERDDWRPVNRQPIQKPNSPITIVPVDRRHMIYTAFLESLTLDGKHADDLMRRGLYDTFIANNLFASVPGESKAKIVCAGLSKCFDLSGVPGFYREGDRWRLSVGDWCAGYFVPVRDLAGWIQALQIRRDSAKRRYVWLSSKDKSQGVTSGSPIHFAAAHRLVQGDVIVTEGALKADVIAQFRECAVIGLAGINSYKPSFGVALRAAGVRAVRIAFDADWRSNLAVRNGLDRLGTLLQDAGLTVSILDWSLDEGKGLDDLLLREVA